MQKKKSNNNRSLAGSLLGPNATKEELEELYHLADVVDLCIQPFFTFFQLLFYLGWLKVAESLVNPFGEDDDDLEINALIDRNVKISNLIVDDLHAEHPDLTEDEGPERLTRDVREGFRSREVLNLVSRMVGDYICNFEVIDGIFKAGYWYLGLFGQLL